ncbi:metalloprotease TIKI2 [Ahaetulla prasina]|uniref:metalloprotease TIKI2 n=1 Tax=Ahaetulla prasina TaxID=499056 RepID=UPI0026499214|nr:metalloprotease TIKI2 [Ahaetulla prasina]XP_058032256.1 metalloprotease TIKI2 [Ahaetulla prasina]
MQPHLALICVALLGGSLPASARPEPRRRQQMDPRRCELPRSQRDLNSFLWTIRRDPPAYLFGTIHVPYTRVWDFVPENSKAAFQASSSVYFELDLTNPSTISGLANCQLLPRGENLQDVLPRDLYHRLKRHLEYVRLMLPHWMSPDQRGKGLYADYLFNAIAGNWERKRPVWVMLMVNSLTETDVRSRGVPVLDLHLAQEAERMRKVTGAVERVEEQCHPLNGLNFSQVLFALNQTLLQHESLRAGSWQAPYTTEDLIKHYNCGDLNAVIFNHDSSQLPNFINTTLPPHEQVTAQEIDRYFRQELIYKRNERMGKRVMALLRQNTDKSFFFAFGAGHFLGNNTVIDVLRQAGFEVEHIPAGQPVENPKASRYHSSSATAASVVIEHIQLSSSSALPHANEEDSLPPHLLLPDSISQLEEFGRQKNWHKKQYKIHRQRQFNDLWVRIEEGTTTMPSNIRMTDGLISVNPSIWFSNQVDQPPHPDLAFRHHLKSCALESTIASLFVVSVLTAMASVLSDLLNPS